MQASIRRLNGDLLLRIARRISTRKNVMDKVLKFDNKALRSLPLDTVEENYVRTVSGACFSRLKPTPVNDPELIVYSKEALELLDIPEELVQDPQFVDVFAGNKILEGSEPASHCYCGHQFGSFAGQLGDGAAIYLGEVVNKKGERWELQLKGAGLTPYSRTADGRKVLRSSVREFMCSEAMYHLGVPTTRAATCITSSDTVVRDVFYDGHPIEEKCSIVSRIAPTFIRFGSFEIFKTMDPSSGRRGPSVGRMDILLQLLHYVIDTFYPEISKEHPRPDATLEQYKAFYAEVVRRTAHLVAHWQCVGFCHGVLNTDNMSIIGVTIDYGPFGFMERFDPDHICNASDDGGRYTYVKQPAICKWNLHKFGEAISSVFPMEESSKILNEVYDTEFRKLYFEKMCYKLGLIERLVTSSVDKVLNDEELVQLFLVTMEKTGADFSNSFRALNVTSLPGLPGFDESIAVLEKNLLGQCCSLEAMIKGNQTGMDSRQFQIFAMLLQTNPGLLEQFGQGREQIEQILSKLEKVDKLKELDADKKKAADAEAWKEWISRYVERLRYDVRSVHDEEELRKINETRIQNMNDNNPRFVLRNYLAQTAIKKAEAGDYSEVSRLMKVLQNPYSESFDVSELMDESETGASRDSTKVYEGKAPQWACSLKVGCSS